MDTIALEMAHEDNGLKGRFFVKNNNDITAEMVYTWAGKDKIIIEHTEVDKKLEGQGIGKKLLNALVIWVRAQHIQVIPLCPFAKAVMEKRMDEYKDVLSGYKQ